MNDCYHSTIKEMISLDSRTWLDTMKSNFKEILPELELENPQIEAWKDSFIKLKEELKKLDPKTEGYIIFEYLLPKEGGRRPDVILLLENKVIILEFKMKENYSRVDLDQLKGYYRDITGYHKESENLEVIPFLVSTKAENKDKIVYGIYHICSSDKLADILLKKLEGKELEINIDTWLNSIYSPLPTLIEAARDIFNNEDLKELKTAKSAGIYKALDKLKSLNGFIEKQDKKNKKVNVLSLVTGVPGAGKTLLGLEFVHQSEKGSFLSGNGPLVKVLQYVLKSKTFVSELYKFKGEYTNNTKEPYTNILVFDEAQRAWDKEKNSKYKKSEAECIISIADKTKKSCHYLGLIGEGQEIHIGEEQGISMWREAIEKSNKTWHIACPDKIKSYFKGLENVHIANELNLDNSLRSHKASSYPEWVKGVLENNPNPNLAETIIKDSFNIYITRDLEKAKRYCRIRYKGTNKKYGLLTSSQMLPFKKDKLDKLGPWYHADVKSQESCCSFNDSISEFECQGLEIDIPILVWGNDLLYQNNKWVLIKGNTKLKDPYKIKINSYRVLMTRGRDGMIIYVPQDKKYNETYDYLVRAGATGI